MILALCDDDPVFLNKIRQDISKYLSEKDCNAKLMEFSSGKNLVNYLRKEHIDAVFLDIDMPDIDGFKTAKIIKSISPECRIIFCSNYNTLVYDSFEYDPFWFLCKDNYSGKLSDVLEKLMDSVAHEDLGFVLKQKKGLMLKLKYQNIIYVTVDNHILMFHCIDGDIEGHGNISDIEEQFINTGFVKINSGCLVNLAHIKKIKDNNMVIDNREALPVSRRRKKEITEAFYSYLLKK